MPVDDESDDETPQFGAPLPPDDRLWRHPSELGPVSELTDHSADATSTADRRSATNVFGIAIVAGLVGAALSLGVVAVVGGLRAQIIEKPAIEKVPVRAVSELASSSSGVVGATRSIAPAVARLEVSLGSGLAIGSGVFFRNDGYLVTDLHLVQSATSVQVVLSDGRSMAGAVVGSDKWTDIAVIKTDGGTVPVATLGSATDLQVGQAAIAIGSPQGGSNSPSVTVGVVSALGKQMNSSDGMGLHNMIATDAASATGASGGALCDANGVVIGLITSVSPPESSTLDAAAPIDVVRSAAEDIINTGTAHHSWLGVEGVDADTGARVTNVVDDSPADAAGLLDNDVIDAVDGMKIRSMSALAITLRGHHAGDAITMVVTRNGQNLTITATLAERNP